MGYEAHAVTNSTGRAIISEELDPASFKTRGLRPEIPCGKGDRDWKYVRSVTLGQMARSDRHSMAALRLIEAGEQYGTLIMIEHIRGGVWKRYTGNKNVVTTRGRLFWVNKMTDD